MGPKRAAGGEGGGAVEASSGRGVGRALTWKVAEEGRKALGCSPPGNSANGSRWVGRGGRRGGGWAKGRGGQKEKGGGREGAYSLSCTVVVLRP